MFFIFSMFSVFSMFSTLLHVLPSRMAGYGTTCRALSTACVSEVAVITNNLLAIIFFFFRRTVSIKHIFISLKRLARLLFHCAAWCRGWEAGTYLFTSRATRWGLVVNCGTIATAHAGFVQILHKPSRRMTFLSHDRAARGHQLNKCALTIRLCSIHQTWNLSQMALV